MSTHIPALAKRAKGHMRGWLANRRFAKYIRPSDVFIVSYPKSGTNWVGFFIASIISKTKPTTASPLTLSNYRQYVPDINAEYFARRPLHQYQGVEDPRFFTVHAPYNSELKRVIYLVRDPRDVMVSYYFHHRRTVAGFNMPINEFVINNHMWPCDWGSHVAGWLSNGNTRNAYLIRYEDLHRDGYYWFEKIAAFCGCDVSEEEVRGAMEDASFTNMRLVEERWGVHGSDGDKSIRFMRQGRDGGWREELSEDVVEIVERRYWEIMVRLGYTEGSIGGQRT